MRRSRVSILRSLLCFWLCLSLVSCEEGVPTQVSVDRTTRWEVFQPGRTGYSGICCDSDTQYVAFSFPTYHDDAQTFFGTVEAEALRQGWGIVDPSCLRRVRRSGQERRFQARIDELFPAQSGIERCYTGKYPGGGDELISLMYIAAECRAVFVSTRHYGMELQDYVQECATSEEGTGRKREP